MIRVSFANPCNPRLDNVSAPRLFSVDCRWPASANYFILLRLGLSHIMLFRVLAAAGLVGLASLHLAAQTAPAAGIRSTEELYKQACQACHMADGNAALEPMNFADGKWRHGTTVKELSKVISDGVPGTAMMPFKTRFTQEEIVALAKYVRTFDKSLKSAPAAKKKAATK